MGSIAGRVGGVLAGPHYCASKGGIHAIVKWAAKNGMKYGIYVNGIASGLIATPMTEDEPFSGRDGAYGKIGRTTRYCRGCCLFGISCLKLYCRQNSECERRDPDGVKLNMIIL